MFFILLFSPNKISHTQIDDAFCHFIFSLEYSTHTQKKNIPLPHPEYLLDYSNLCTKRSTKGYNLIVIFIMQQTHDRFLCHVIYCVAYYTIFSIICLFPITRPKVQRSTLKDETSMERKDSVHSRTGTTNVRACARREIRFPFGREQHGR